MNKVDLEKSPKYGPHGAVTESTIQDAVNLMWSSFPDDPEFVIEEHLGNTLVAIWHIDNTMSDSPPQDSPCWRQKV